MGKGWPLRRKALKLKPLPRAYTKFGCHHPPHPPPPPPTNYTKAIISIYFLQLPCWLDLCWGLRLRALKFILHDDQNKIFKSCNALFWKLEWGHASQTAIYTLYQIDNYVWPNLKNCRDIYIITVHCTTDDRRGSVSVFHPAKPSKMQLEGGPCGRSYLSKSDNPPTANSQNQNIIII